MYLSILKEAFIIWGIQGIMYIYVSFNIKRGFFYLGGSFWNYVYIYPYLYVSFNIKRGFFIWGIQGIMYIYLYVSFNIKRGFYYLGGSFWRCVFIYPQFARCLK